MARMVEADRDGRLDQRDQASLSRHLAVCAECRAFAGDLARLGELVERPLGRPTTPLEHQRARLALLNDAAMLGASHPTPGSRWGTPKPRLVIGLAAAAVFAISAVGLGAPLVTRVLGRGASGDQPAAMPVAVAHKLPSVPRLADPVTMVAPAPNPLPPGPISHDGESLRTPGLDGQPADSTNGSPPREAPRRPGTGPTGRAPRGATSSATAASANPVAAGDDAKAFAEGMRLIARGDYAAGADKLDAYQHANPSDARAEDAAYLSVLALQRAGRRDAAVAAARRYLQQYPRGYRHAEVQAIAAAPAPR
jgi:hypothetical protein